MDQHLRAGRILIVDDEGAVRETVALALRGVGFEVAEAADAETALRYVAKRRPDLVLLEWVLPKMSGLDLARVLGRTRPSPSIIVVSGRDAEQDRVTALDCGADDYVTKPFSVRELLARIHAVLRRRSAGQFAERNEVSSLVLDAVRSRVLLGDAAVVLRSRDFRLLEFLASNPERVHSRTELIDYVWGGGDRIGRRTVDVQIRRLREALRPLQCERCVQTVHGAGYRFSTRAQ